MAASVVLAGFFVLCGALRFGEAFNLTVLHTNDVHSHFIEFNVNGGRCVEKLKEQKKCYGGFARQVTKVHEIRANDPHVLFLNGGDFYQGTVWYTLHRWQIVAELVNQLTIDAMSLGNHEFDDGLKGLFPYLENLKTRVVVCNINASRVPGFSQHVRPSTVVEVGGERIGVIGYLTPETKALSSAGDLDFEDEVVGIQREARRLVEEEGLNKIMAVGHSGFDVDLKIAREVPEVDVVVGGHTNTFLYTGPPASDAVVEEVQGEYPTVVRRDDGSLALVVQDFAFGKYMGYLQVEFDDEGRVTHWGGNPILLDASVAEDAATLELLAPYGDEVKRRGRQTLGKTNVLLRGDRMTCRMRECNLGNFLADASLDYFVEMPPPPAGWNFAAVALWNSGGIRASIDERLNEGNITLEDILSVAPFGNTMDVVLLKGKHLREVLENSVNDYDLHSIDPPGSFLQVSGLRLTYNVSNPIGHRLIDAQIRCADCRVPKYGPLEEEAEYWVVMASYMAKGGDGFASIQKNSLGNRNTDELDIDIITKYAQKNSPVTHGEENRITVLSAPVESKHHDPESISHNGEHHPSARAAEHHLHSSGDGPLPTSNDDEHHPPSSDDEHHPPSSDHEHHPPSSGDGPHPPSGGDEHHPPSSDHEHHIPSSGDGPHQPSSDDEHHPPSSGDGGIMDGLSAGMATAESALRSAGEKIAGGLEKLGSGVASVGGRFMPRLGQSG